MYTIAAKQPDGTVLIVVTADLANFSGDITPEIVAEVDRTGCYLGEPVILKEGLWQRR